MASQDDLSPTLYLICGLPGSGKTTRALQIAKATPAIRLCADDWMAGLGASLVDDDFRARLQGCLLDHAAQLLSRGIDVALEFGSWSRSERAAIRRRAEEEGALVELHFMNAPLDVLVERVRARGGPEAAALTDVLQREGAKFEEPSAEEQASFERYVGPEQTW